MEEISMEKVTLDYCRSLPKAELHAHLNGSISDKTMQMLLHRSGSEDQRLLKTVIEKGERRTMEEGFSIFGIIHRNVNDEESIAKVAASVVQDFDEDNVKYLELRTTPRANPNTGMTKQSYIQSVVKGIQNGLEHCSPHMQVRLLLSIDRRQSAKEAADTLRLALEYSTAVFPQGRVVGLDFSGDPRCENIKQLMAVLEEAKSRGLKLAVHLAEISDREDESELLVGVLPDRIGHATYLHKGQFGTECRAVQTVLKEKIPLEMCLTSNLKTRTISSYKDHHFGFWKSKGHPLALCTDDKGVFATSLSEEYLIASQAFGLTRSELRTLAKAALEYGFDNDCKKDLVHLFNQ